MYVCLFGLLVYCKLSITIEKGNKLYYIIILYCIVSHCIVLYFIVMHCIILYCIVSCDWHFNNPCGSHVHLLPHKFPKRHSQPTTFILRTAPTPGGVLGSIFAGYVPLASQNPYPIIPHSSLFCGQL